MFFYQMDGICGILLEFALLVVEPIELISLVIICFFFLRL